MSKAITKEDMALLKEASEMFNETGCVPGIDGEQAPAKRMVPDVKEYLSETIDDPEAIYDPEIWDAPHGTNCFVLVAVVALAADTDEWVTTAGKGCPCGAPVFEASYSPHSIYSRRGEQDHRK